MWITTNKGFFSVVEASESSVMIRARREGELKQAFPDQKIIETPRADYRYRVIVSKAFAAKWIAGELLAIDYDNFKDSIPEKDKALKNACASVWTVMGRLQPGGPYGYSMAKLTNKALDPYRLPLPSDPAEHDDYLGDDDDLYEGDDMSYYGPIHSKPIG